MHNKKRTSYYRSSLPAAMIALLLGGTSGVQAQTLEKSAPAGLGIYEAVISKKDPHIYVTGAGSRSEPQGGIYKIRLDDLSIVDTIHLSEHPPFGIGINNKTHTVYTSNTRTNSVSAVDLNTGELLATIRNGAEKSHTRKVLVDEKNNLVYVSDVGKPSNIWVIDGETNTYLHSIPETGASTTGICFAGNTDEIYVTNLGDHTVGVIDVKTRKLVRSFPSGGESPINITSDGERLFVTHQGSGTLTVLDKEGNIIKDIPTGEGAIGVAYDPVKNHLYSANRKSGTTTVIDASSYEVLADLPTGSHPNHVKIDPSSGLAYVVNKTKRIKVPEGQAPVKDSQGDTLTKIK